MLFRKLLHRLYKQSEKKRILDHTKGKVKSTEYRIPVELVTFIAFNKKYSAYHFEKYLKSGSGRAFMNKRFIPI
jgi:predicted GIY-YIG superfamily endonuclease